MKIVNNVKTGVKATGGFVKKHKVAAIGIGTAILAAVGAVVGIKVSKGHQSDAPETTDEPSEETSEES